MQAKAAQAQSAIKTRNDQDASTNPAVSSTSGRNKLDPIAVLREELAAAALCHGVERVEDLTEELVRRYVLRLGGVQVYVRSRRAQDKERAVREIRRRFDGCNLRVLAEEFGVTLRHARRVVAK